MPMKQASAFFLLLLIFIPSGGFRTERSVRFPYREAGLTDRQAAVHLLDRFTFGPRPGDIERVCSKGPEDWLNDQLNANLDDRLLQEKLKPFEVLNLSIEGIVNSYPNPGMILKQANRDGIISRGDSSLSRPEVRRKLEEYMATKGYKPQRELLGALTAQKVLRALTSNNQLKEVLTDFWFNHFNVSITDNQARTFVLSYERDAIRPKVFGRFKEMLFATAKHPAMLLYLDNAQSTAPEGAMTPMGKNVERLRNQPGVRGAAARKRIDTALAEESERREQMMKDVPDQFRQRKGLNENYARELMELHTLGVDGGYTQKDVVEVARAFTGWTVMPMGQRQEQLRKRIERGKGVGFLREGLFLFRADSHDATEKTILGATFAAGGGKEEGERVLEMLAKHPSTAKHIAGKLARRFVSDSPPQSLVDRLATLFATAGGDTKAMIRAIVESPEFWSREALRAKIKTPFELVLSSLRALDADLTRPRAIIQWIARIGEPLYACQPPTGYPDVAESWVNSGALLQRMNFGLNLALGTIPGVSVEITKLTGGREPESMEAALEQYVGMLLPERDLSGTLRLIRPSLSDPEFRGKVSAAAPADDIPDAMGEEAMEEFDGIGKKEKQRRQQKDQTVMRLPANTSPLAQAVGVILGSPEFQRH